MKKFFKRSLFRISGGILFGGRFDFFYYPPYPSSCHPYLSDSGLTFDIYALILLRGIRTTSIDEAEALFCEVYPYFLNKLNAVRSIRPLLASFPLDPDSCQLNIMFVDERDVTVRPPSLIGVGLGLGGGSGQGELEFSQHTTKNAAEGSGPYETVVTRKARDIPGLKKFYQPKCPRSKASVIPRGFQFSEDSWCCKGPRSQEQICELKSLCYQTNLAITTVGSVGRNHFDMRPVEFALRGSQQFSLEESRKLASTCLQHMLTYIQNSQLHKERIKKWWSSPSCCHVSSEPASDQIAFRINFWDENIDRPVAPHIAEIRLLDDKLSYFTADENQCLILVFEETVKDCLQEAPPVAAPGKADGK